MSPATPAARLRGTATGLLTAALAIAAHGAAGGAVPGGAAAVQLAVVAGTVGTLAAIGRRAAEASTLVVLLTGGQLVGHLVLAAGHAHASAAPAAVMLGAHVAATAAGAMLIAAGDRLCRAVSRAVRWAARVTRPVIAAEPAAAPVRRADQPLRSALLLAASLSHRGPPVSPAR